MSKQLVYKITAILVALSTLSILARKLFFHSTNISINQSDSNIFIVAYTLIAIGLILVLKFDLLAKNKK